MSAHSQTSTLPDDPAGRWSFWIDRGGTFTDIVARRPDGTLVTSKLLSADPGHYADAALEGMRRLLAVPRGAPLPPQRIAAVKMGTTVATNALLERAGAPTLLLVTRGFADALRIGYQNRPRLFDRHIVVREPLYAQVAEVDERVDAAGNVLRALDAAAARAVLRAARGCGLASVAIVLMHGWRHPAHEQVLEAIAREEGFTQVTASHVASPLIKLVSRGNTAVVDAYLSPVLRRYVQDVAAALPGTPLLFMQSHGGLAEAAAFQGRDSILSGPAGGVVGAVCAAAEAGFGRVIGFDMGGTSTDVCHFDGRFERVFESEVAGAPVRMPMLAVHTVAAGGGSLVRFDAGRFRAGPQSAGADPGPACYRKGGPLTVTDCNVLLGRIQPDHFPHVFGRDADQPLDAAVVAERFRTWREAILAAGGGDHAVAAVAAGCIEIAVQNMANAIKKVSVQRGHDITRYVLCCFGGAAGQHACLVADALGMDRALIHPMAGVLSAWGIGQAEIRALREQAVEEALTLQLPSRLEARFAALEADCRASLARQGAGAGVAIARTVRLRYAGTDAALVVEAGDFAALIAAFEAQHRRRFGFVMPGRELAVSAIAVEGAAASGAVAPMPPLARRARAAGPVPEARVALWTGASSEHVPLFRRAALMAGDAIAGPALVVEDTTTIVVDPGWTARMDTRHHLMLERTAPRPARHAAGTEVDPVRLEVFNNRFMAIAEQMGATLANTAHSVNIKERLDFSCAIFDRIGRLVANAPHIPVHLGSMGESVRCVIGRNAGAVAPGDVFVLNAPYAGGTHLPDVTVVTPVFDAGGRDILFWLGSRGHHADIGGVSPGSMPARSRTVHEEGVVIDNFRLVERGTLREAEMEALLAGGPWPARNPRQNMADLRAQVAANAAGAEQLAAMVGEFGLPVVEAYMGHVQRNAEESVRRILATLQGGSAAIELDSGAVIRVDIRVDRAARSAVIDFTGTSPQSEDNFNAPASICRAAVLYVFRTLVDEDIPLNEGCLAPLTLIVPEGCLLNPRHPAAVAAGNVETSQCITDALYAALGVLAGSQGTMNNFTFGDSTYQYYETIAGGAGAGPGFNGAGAVQVHMTNSRLTDPEVLELRFPVLVEAFMLRSGSGGAGRWHGGDGVVRRIRFLRAMSAAILSGRRRVPPQGLAGGSPGACGRNAVIRRDGRREELPGTGEAAMGPGDVFEIETPGGGGYGVPG